MMPRRVVSVPLPTAFGTFDAHAFEVERGVVHLPLVRGDLGDGRSVLARVHSECLTGDALGSLRYDCGGDRATRRCRPRLLVGGCRGRTAVAVWSVLHGR
jgi:GTP cyclohydrolase II